MRPGMQTQQGLNCTILRMFSRFLYHSSGTDPSCVSKQLKHFPKLFDLVLCVFPFTFISKTVKAAFTSLIQVSEWLMY